MSTTAYPHHHPSTQISHDLAQINTTLQHELEHAISIASVVNSENEVLKNAYNTLKQELQDLGDKYTDAQKVAEQTLSAKHSIEVECEGLYKQWQQQLKVYNEQIDTLKASTVPRRELDLVRINVSEELSHHHKEQLAEVAIEAERYRDLYLKQQHDFLVLQTEFSHVQQEHQHLLHEQKLLSDSQLHDLHTKNQKLQELIQGNDQIHTIRTLERTNNELIIRTKQLQDELQQQVQQQTQLQATHSSEVQGLQKLIDGLKQQVTESEVTAEQALKRVSTTTTDLDACRRLNTTLTDKALQLETQVSTLDNKLDTRHHDVQQLKEHHDRQLLDAQRSRDEVQRRLQSEIDEVQRKYKELSGKHSDAVKQLDHVQRETTLQLKQQQVDETEKRQRVEAERDSLLVQTASLQKQISEFEALKSSSDDTLRLTIEQLRTELKQIRHDNEQSSNKLAKDRVELQRQKDEFTAKQQSYIEMQSQYEQLQKRHSTLTDGNNTHQHQLDRLRAATEDSAKEIATLTTELQEERQRCSRLIQQSTQQHKQEKHILLQRIAQLEATVESSNTATTDKADDSESVATLKADKLKYKRMAATLKQQAQTLINEMTVLKRDNERLNNASRKEHDMLRQHLQDVERQRDELKLRLAAAGLGHDVLPTASSTLPTSPLYNTDNNSRLRNGTRDGQRSSPLSAHSNSSKRS